MNESLKGKVYYHVRTAQAVTLDWTESKSAALLVAEKERAQVYEVHSVSGRSIRIY